MLATICAKTFKEAADALEAGKRPEALAKEFLTESWNVLFNGDGYDELEQQTLIKRGVWHTDSIVQAMQAYTAPKNLELFNEMKVLSSMECVARQRILLDNYSHVVEIEANCMIDMVQRHALPSLRRSTHDGSLSRATADKLEAKLVQTVGSLKAATEEAMKTPNEVKTVNAYFRT
jgi:glutamine synthetase